MEICFTLITGDDLGPLWTRFRKTSGNFTPQKSPCSLSAPSFWGPPVQSSRSFFRGGEFFSIPQRWPRVGIQERFDEICEKYELRDGDAAGEAWGLWMGRMGQQWILWSLRSVWLLKFFAVLQMAKGPTIWDGFSRWQWNIRKFAYTQILWTGEMKNSPVWCYNYNVKEDIYVIYALNEE